MKKNLLLLVSCVVLSCGLLTGCGGFEEGAGMGGEISVEESNKVLQDFEVLPIGTVVQLKTGNRKLMVNGYLQFELKDKKKLYDYSGVLYPQGQLNTEESYLFNKDQIERVFYLGYISDEQQGLNKKIKQLKEKHGKK